MDDLISRQAAIDAVNGLPDCPNGFSGTYDKATIIGILEEVPSSLVKAVANDEERTTDDAIDRQAALKEAYPIIYNGEVFRVIQEETLLGLPSVQSDVLDTNVGDMISRQAAIDALGEEPEVWTGKDEYAQGLNNQWHYDKNAILAVPSVQPQRWIPVTERLPEEDRNVLVSVHFKGFTQTHPNGWKDHIKESYYVEVASHFDGDWSSVSDEYKVARNRHEVIAWMPLPKPWRGGQDDEIKRG